MEYTAADLEVERFVLGGIIVKPETLGDVWFLQGDSFHDPYHSRVYQAIQSLSKHDLPFDLVALRVELERTGGESNYTRLGGLVDGVCPTPRNVRAHARRIFHRALQHSLRNETDADAVTLREYAERMGQADDDGGGMVGMKTLMQETVERLQAPPRPVALSGLIELDRTTGGFFRGQLILIAARPSMGKTALLVRVAMEAAKEGNRVAFISAEMTRHEICMRMLASVARVNLHALQRKVEWSQEMDDAAHQVEALPIEVCDLSDGGSRPADIDARVRAKDFDVVVVDYLGLLQPDSLQETRNLEVSSISAALKRIAKERNLAMIAASQLSRAADKKSIPDLSDLRDSGSLEQDADVVIFIGKHGPTEPNVSMSVAKNRNGPVGVSPCIWHPRFASFENGAGF